MLYDFVMLITLPAELVKKHTKKLIYSNSIVYHVLWTESNVECIGQYVVNIGLCDALNKVIVESFVPAAWLCFQTIISSVLVS